MEPATARTRQNPHFFMYNKLYLFMRHLIVDLGGRKINSG